MGQGREAWPTLDKRGAATLLGGSLWTSLLQGKGAMVWGAHGDERPRPPSLCETRCTRDRTNSGRPILVSLTHWIWGWSLCSHTSTPQGPSSR